MPRTPERGRERRENAPDYKALKNDLEAVGGYLWWEARFTLKRSEDPKVGNFIGRMSAAYQEVEKVQTGLGNDMSEVEAARRIASILETIEMDRTSREEIFGKKPKKLKQLDKEIASLRRWAYSRVQGSKPSEFLFGEPEITPEVPAEEILEEAKVDEELAANLHLSDAFTGRPEKSAATVEEMALRQAKAVYLAREEEYYDSYQLVRSRKSIPREERIALEGRNMQIYTRYVHAREMYIEKTRLSLGTEKAVELRAKLVERDMAIAAGIEYHYMPEFLRKTAEEKAEEPHTNPGKSFMLALGLLVVSTGDAALIGLTTKPRPAHTNPNQIWFATAPEQGMPRRAPETDFMGIAEEQAEAARRRGSAQTYVPTAIGSERGPAAPIRTDAPSVEVAEEEPGVVIGGDAETVASNEDIEGGIGGGPVALSPEPPPEP